jgi:hypothetical protein
VIIKNFVEHEDGSATFEYHASPEELSFMLNYAVMDLIKRGIIQVSAEEAEMEFEMFKEDGGIVQ